MDQFEEHVCVNECFCFPKMEKSEYQLHLDDHCPFCQEKRFEIRGKSFSPRKKFYRIPLSFQIQNLTRNPDFSASLSKMKAELNMKPSANESFWGAEIVSDLTESHKKR